ncbi:Protein phosphatase 2C 70 [Vitis vinifera]|uniref:protein-serine/threonine phosphatase n=1 Tax=Vitis vinifera TaxID=29760 RepID=A0A438F640_VITVI|nr:Protein phosphatase 2C 70 [Vitis vinifera]
MTRQSSSSSPVFLLSSWHHKLSLKPCGAWASGEIICGLLFSAFLDDNCCGTLLIQQVGDLERPLVPEDLDLVPNQSNELGRSYDLGGSCVQSEGYLNSPRTHGLVHKQRIPLHLHIWSKLISYSCKIKILFFSLPDGSLILDLISDASEDVLVGQTLKRPFMLNHSIEEQSHIGKEELSYDLKFDSENDRFQAFVRQDIVDQKVQEAASLWSYLWSFSRDRCSISSTNTSRLPLTLGRVSPSDLLVKDSEVSGKHALINWNLNKLKWELVDMGSLNGTLLNSQSVNHPDSGMRHWGDPIELASGDIITLGTTSKNTCTFGLGIASDPMALRRGGKKLPMEDVCYYHWPLPGTDQFGLFGICDGHGGAAAAKSASKILPEMVASILSDSLKREKFYHDRMLQKSLGMQFHGQKHS